MINILYVGSCWTTNIGNAFISLGTLNLLRQAVGNAGRVHHFGNISAHLFWANSRPDNNIDLAHFAKFDFVVTSGMALNVGTQRYSESMFKGFVADGAKLLVVGGGPQKYDDAEVQALRALIARAPIHAFVSRDRYSFEKYADLAPHSYDGIDCALFVSDGFLTMPLKPVEYNVLCFDKYREPLLTNVGQSEDEYSGPWPDHKSSFPKKVRTAIRRAVAKKRHPLGEPAVASLDMGGRQVIRTHHSTWAEDLRPEFFASPRCMISDVPTDYLALYAGAHTVYSDRVHACLVALAFGRRAIWVRSGEPRLHMFARLGVPEVTTRPVSLDMTWLAEEKRKQVKFVRGVLGLA